MSNLLTIHKITPLPYSNLNRDETGTPKRVRQGGVMRTLLSSQSIKRAIRTDFEMRALNQINGFKPSIRSAHLAEEIVERALSLNSTLNEKVALKEAKKLVDSLAKSNDTKTQEESEDPKSKGEDPKSKGKAKKSQQSIWLSDEEINAAANYIAGKAANSDFINAHTTGSLAIAAFGRMFAKQPGNNTEAAIAVSPAISTHAALIESDYFTTVDDRPSEKQGSGATYLGISSYTNAVMYQTVTIDRDQLRRSWSGFESESAQALLEQLIRSIIYKFPRGKENGTGPYSLPLVVLAEEQSYRFAYDFETPVTATANGGYGAESVKRLATQRKVARNFDPKVFGELSLVAGTVDLDTLGSFDAEITDVEGLTNKISQWILADQ